MSSIQLGFLIEGNKVILEVGATAITKRSRQSSVDTFSLASAKISPDLVILQEYAGLLKAIVGNEPPPEVMVLVATIGRCLVSILALPQRSHKIGMQFETQT